MPDAQATVDFFSAVEKALPDPLDLLSPEARAVLDAITSAPIAWALLDDLKDAGHAQDTIDALVASKWLESWDKVCEPRLDRKTGWWWVYHGGIRGGRRVRKNLALDRRWKGVGGGWPKLTTRLKDGRTVRRLNNPPQRIIKEWRRYYGTATELALTLTPYALDTLGLMVVEYGAGEVPRFGLASDLSRVVRWSPAKHEAGYLSYPELVADHRAGLEVVELMLDPVTEEPVVLFGGHTIRIDPRLAKQRPGKRKALAVGA